MSTLDGVAPAQRRWSTGRIVSIAAVVVLVIAMALCTKVVGKNSDLAQKTAKFSAVKYGKKQFPVQAKFIADHAVDARTLAGALAKDPTAAAKQYGVSVNGGATTEVPVTFTGVVGKVPAAGYAPIKVAGLPGGTSVNAQLGPAIIGTDIRDATGKIELGDFENQIQFQDAASAMNNQTKAVLQKAGAPELTGKTVTVTGVFALINPKLWNVTPTALEVQK